MFLVMTSQDAMSPTSTDPERTIFMWGEITDVALVIDLVGFLHQTRRTAVLTVVHDAVRKSIYFRDGSVIAASSDQPEDRFGDIMFRRGMIDRAQLDQALGEVGPERKIGNVLLQQGLISTGDLWKVIKIQIEEILYSLLLLDQARFTVAVYDPTQVPTRTALDTQFLLLEGLRRKDELQHLKESLPPPEQVLARTSLTTTARLEAAEQRLLGLVDGTRTVAEVFNESGLGEFGACQALHRILQLGLASEASTTEPGEAGGGGTTVGAILNGYNEAYAQVDELLRAADAAGRYRAGLESFFADADEEVAALFDNVNPGPDGRIDPQGMQANLKLSSSQDKLFVLRRGLSDYLRFLLFIAREALPFEQVEVLASDVRKRVAGL